MTFQNSVFINCPFDDEYRPILRAVVFCVLHSGFQPRIATERLDSGEPRFTKLVELIVDSQFAIHDLSRIKAAREGELFRLNMPFELGLDVGCRTFKGGQWSDKRCLILEAERYRYQAAISDISNSDISAHKNEPELALKAVRQWLSQHSDVDLPGPAALWARYQDFMADNYERLVAKGFSPTDVDELDMREFMKSVRKWLSDNPI